MIAPLHNPCILGCWACNPFPSAEELAAEDARERAEDAMIERDAMTASDAIFWLDKAMSLDASYPPGLLDGLQKMRRYWSAVARSDY